MPSAPTIFVHRRRRNRDIWARVRDDSSLNHHPALAFLFDQQRMLRLGLRLRSVATGAIAPLGHELVELGPVLGKA